MLIFSGLELASAGVEASSQGRRSAAVALGTAAGCLALKSTGLGCVVGLAISSVQSLLEQKPDGEEEEEPSGPKLRAEARNDGESRQGAETMLVERGETGAVVHAQADTREHPPDEAVHGRQHHHGNDADSDVVETAVGRHVVVSL